MIELYRLRSVTPTAGGVLAEGAKGPQVHNAFGRGYALVLTDH